MNRILQMIDHHCSLIYLSIFFCNNKNIHKYSKLIRKPQDLLVNVLTNPLLIDLHGIF